MAQNPDTPSDRAQPSPRRPAARGKGRLIVRKLAQSTLLAAGMAASQVSIPEIDPRFPMFDRTLVDRLQAPVTRHHE
jgi:hypothetical protein